MIVYERTLRLRRGESVVPFTIRLENLRPTERGINEGVEANLIVEGLGSRLDLSDDLPISLAIFSPDTLSCILCSVVWLRGLLKPLEHDIGWERDVYGWFGLPMLHEYTPPYGIEFEREIEALIDERMNARLEEHLLARRVQRETDDVPPPSQPG